MKNFKIIKKNNLTNLFPCDKTWENSNQIEICEYRKESSDHHPKTTVNLCYDKLGLYIYFNVNDAFTKAIHKNNQEQVCEDSCVEFFVKPKNVKGYFNFEFNPIGTILSFYITDHTRTKNLFKEYTVIEKTDLELIKIDSKFKKIIKEEISSTWYIKAFIPFDFFAKYAKSFTTPEIGETWSGNFYKCGDKTSHPHWGAWQEVPELNFHLPKSFGKLIFMDYNREISL